MGCAKCDGAAARKYRGLTSSHGSSKVYNGLNYIGLELRDPALSDPVLATFLHTLTHLLRDRADGI